MDYKVTVIKKQCGVVAEEKYSINKPMYAHKYLAYEKGKVEYSKDGLFNKWYSNNGVFQLEKNTIRVLSHTINKIHT